MPGDISKLLKCMADNEVGLVVGSRITGGSADETHIRKFGGIVLNKFVNLFFGTKLTDAINGFKVFRRDVYDRFIFHPEGYAIEIELISSALRLGYRVVEIPTFEPAREKGVAKSRILRDGWSFFKKIFKEGLSYHKIGIIGFLVSGLVCGLIIFLVFRKTLDMGLFGDDWGFVGFATKPEYQGFWESFAGSYGSNTFFMRVVINLFGRENFLAFYGTSMVLRLFAALGIFSFVYFGTGSRIVAFLASLLFSVLSTGLQTTDWVFNSPAYLSIGLAAIFLATLLLVAEKREISLLKILILTSTFTLSVILMPNRMNTLIIVGIAYLFLSVVFLKAKFKHLLLVSTLLILLQFIFYKFHFFGTSVDNTFRVTKAVGEIRQAINLSNFDFLINPLATTAKMFLPDTLVQKDFVMPLLGRFASGTNIFIMYFITLAAFAIGTFSSLSLLMKQKSRKGFLIISFGFYAIFWLVIFLARKLNPLNLNDYYLYTLSSLGAIILSVFIGFAFSGTRKLRLFALLGVLTIPSLSLISQIYFPLTYFGIFNRYLVSNMISVAVFWSCILTLVLKSHAAKTLKYSAYIVFSLFTLVHIHSSRIFIEENYKKHPAVAVRQVWSDFINLVPDIPNYNEKDRSRNALFLFLPKDEKSSQIVGATIDFSSTYKIWVEYPRFKRISDIGYMFTFKKEDFRDYIKKYNTPKELIYIFEVKNYRLVDKSEDFRNGKLEELAVKAQ